MSPGPSPLATLSRLGSETLAALFESSLDGVLVVDSDQQVRYANPAAAEIAGRTPEQLLATGLLVLIPPAEQPDVLAQLATSAGSRTGRRSATILRPGGERREVEYTVAGASAGEQPLAVVTIRDVTETRRVVRWAAALAQIASSVAYAGTLETMLDALARTLVRVTDLTACTVVLIDVAERQSWRAVASHGLPEGYSEALAEVWRAGVVLPSVHAYERRQPVVQSGVRRRILEDLSCGPLHPFVHAVPWDTIVAVPLIVRGEPVGTLVGYYTPEQAPSEDEIAFLSSIADQAAVAVENTRLFVEAQGKAALLERQKLARELHDSVSQALYGIALGARTARELLERDPPKAAAPLEYVASLAEAGLAEMRALIFELRPESLAQEGLVAALSKQVASLHTRHGITASAALPDEPDVPLPVKEALYRIGQEALHNIVRHARATEVSLALRWEPVATSGAPAPGAVLVLEVQDNGIGFDPDGPFPGHLGLRSMYERAASLGGSLEVESAAGSGTRVTARLPQ
jgi:PAS domain S-box-containing protein